MSSLKETIRYRYLKFPIRLQKTIDQGDGNVVVLLHGIGKTGEVWSHVVKELSNYPCRIIAYDLLGFGISPKPDWLEYNIDDHATAVVKSLEKLRIKEQITIVGHSMGCLIAVRVAKLRPDLVGHLVLYEMPLYEGLPKKRLYRLRLSVYARFYDWVINYQPDFNPSNSKRSQRIAQKVAGFEVNEQTWQPFIKSLKNTIMNQKAIAKDIKQLNVPMDIIYGSFDMLVIRGHLSSTFGSVNDNIQMHKVRARHVISIKASHLIVKRILAPITGTIISKK